MGFLTDGDVNKRVRNLFVAFQNAAPPPPPPSGNAFQLRTAAPDMTFLANYVAAFPAATPIGGTWSAAQTGANGALSSGNAVVAFSSVSSSEGTVSSDAAVNAPCWEIEVLNELGAVDYGVGVFIDFIFPYDKEAFLGGGGGGASYKRNGSIADFVGSPGGPALAIGDVVGVVCTNPNVNPAAHFFINGVPVATGFLLNSGSTIVFPMASSQA